MLVARVQAGNKPQQVLADVGKYVYIERTGGKGEGWMCGSWTCSTHALLPLPPPAYAHAGALPAHCRGGVNTGVRAPYAQGSLPPPKHGNALPQYHSILKRAEFPQGGAWRRPC